MNRTHKILCFLLCLCLCLPMCVSAFADSATERVVVGADLTEDQILSVYATFGVLRGSVEEMTVTNQEERDYLEGLVSDSIIGTRSISCVYIKMLSSGSGITVTTSNISWCTDSMYTSALMTAGVYDAEVMVTAPYSVSGTAALTGIYKAYEDITGETLDEDAKETAVDELVVTAEMTDSGVDQEDAVAIVNDMKVMLDDTQDMTDDELDEQIEDVADAYGYTLDQETIDNLRELVRNLEELDLSGLQDEIENFRDTLDTASQYFDDAKTFWEKVADFFRAIGNFFANLFGGGNKDEAEPEETAAPASEEISEETESEETAAAEEAADDSEQPAETDQTQDDTPADEVGSETADFTDGIYEDQPVSEAEAVG